MTRGLADARTLLFVPGDRPDRFAKAAAAGAGAVVLDLEDAVAPDRKDTAREHVVAWLDAGNDAVVRINAVGTPWHEADVTALAGRPRAIMLPKAESPDDAEALGTAVIVLVETTAGVLDARRICEAPGVVRAAFGHIDLSAELGVDPSSRQALLAVRTALVLASAAAGCAPPLDGVTTALDDPDLLADDTRHAVDLGFTGKLCVHPRQIAVVHAALAPTPDQVAWAREVVAAAGDGSAVAHRGRMVDRPVLLRARRLLDRASP
ncbi:HpcH/HpaI aldolase/citrate lyase family protein [Umezawaea sp. NPDC059074]|uniref:HpcH/HpaI aldolase/citrate lyase family protein n=1 Tax=Umezawaea sp. NPDC059074 TaxID=3346716 RepID=UPI0036D1EE8E